MQKIKLLISLILLFTVACVFPSISGTPTSSPLPTVPPSTSTPSPPPTAIPLPAPTSPGLDRVNIYLVAMGDNGASGKYIGCGDSLVPVEVQIEPTLGVLRAAINELLKLEGQRFYGQSGLYNALNLSDLQLDDVTVIDGKATIALSGDLIFGGECDIPRIEEQLYALAFQFNTVDTVVVTVNGEDIEELLDLRG